MTSTARASNPFMLFRLLAFAALAFAVLVACGESDEDAATLDETPTASDEDAEDGADEGSDSASDPSGNYAQVTISSETFEVPADGTNLCNNLGNMIFGSFAIDANGAVTQAGGGGAARQINFSVPVAGWEAEGLQPPTVNVDILDEGLRWFASTERGLGSVDSWSLTDGMASGEATFELEEAGSGNVVGTETGTFEIVCR